MKKKNKRSYFRKIEDNKYNTRRINLLQHIPKQPKLIQFLINNEADESFIKYIKENSKWFREFLFNRGDFNDTISASFIWYLTEEGYDYWSNLDEKFKLLLG